MRHDASGRPVKLISISDTIADDYTRYPAIIDAGEVAELSFLVGGTIESLPATDAKAVVAGDLIASLDDRDFRSNVASARASFINAEEEFERAKRLAEQDAIARNVLKQRQTQRDIAKTKLDSAEKALTDSVLRAPFTGVIASVVVREKQTVSPGSKVATVINLTTLDATISLPASVITQVPARKDRGAVVVLEAAPELEIAATYSEANLVADATSQTYAVTFSFSAPENMVVLPGMNATVVLKSAGNNASDGSVSVPLAAVQSDGDGQFVWILDQDSMTVSRRDIEVSSGIGAAVVVTSGLSPRDQIVGAGGAYLAEGLKVTPWSK